MLLGKFSNYWRNSTRTQLWMDDFIHPEIWVTQGHHLAPPYGWLLILNPLFAIVAVVVVVTLVVVVLVVVVVVVVVVVGVIVEVVVVTVAVVPRRRIRWSLHHLVSSTDLIAEGVTPNVIWVSLLQKLYLSQLATDLSLWFMISLFATLLLLLPLLLLTATWQNECDFQLRWWRLTY